MTESNDLPKLPQHINDKVEEIFRDYVFDTLRRGRQFRFEGEKYGCGCHTCYRDAVSMYEWAYPEMLGYMDYDEIPDWMMIKSKRDEFYDGGIDHPF